jgi:hypothetical protein
VFAPGGLVRWEFEVLAGHNGWRVIVVRRSSGDDYDGLEYCAWTDHDRDTR